MPPAAHPVHGYSAAQVRTAFSQTKRLLVAAYLDPGTLAGESPAAFARLLAPRLRSDFVRGLDLTGVDKDGLTRNTRSWVASFQTGSTTLVGNVIKVHGVMLAMSATDNGRHVLRVHVNYLFVYPVQRPGLAATRMRIVIHAIGNADFAQWNDPGGPLQIWWFPSGNGGVAGARCDAHDGFIHPDFPASPPDAVQPKGAPVDPYSLTPEPFNVPCRAVTRT